MKKLVNEPRAAVREMLEGQVDVSPHLALLSDENVVVRNNLPAPADRKVAVISGGGSGHERPKMILRSVADLRMVVGMDERRS